jgi:alpha-L-fucosidase
MKKVALICLVLIGLLVVGCQEEQLTKAGKSGVKKYEPTWESLRKYKEIPEWLRNGKFGIYTHWGPYAVHAYGSNTTWYSYALYRDPEGEARKHFEKTFGKLTPEFGYKDLIPKFTAEKFDADEWAELFKKSGAKFAGPVAEHHDGFAMWDTKYSDWNAAKMGPKRDVVAEFEKAVRKRDMKFVTAFHHAANWFFFPVLDKSYDTGDPKNYGLYGQPHKEGAMRNQAFIDEWYGKIYEVIDNYSPDFIWFDFALDSIPEGYVKDFLAYYYNDAEAKGKEVVVTYKGNDLVPATGVRDLELGQESKITYHEWITDSTVDDRGAWGYANDLVFKTPDRVIDNLVDRVSKNGYLLLNVGPKPDGTIPEPARDLLLEMGAWLDVNGEGIYDTSPWTIAGEGPTNLGEATDIGFNEADTVYTKKDVRFTVKGDTLYATFLAWPGEYAVIRTLRGEGDQAEEFEVPREDSGPVDPALAVDGKTFTLERRGRKSTYEFKDDGKVTITSPSRREGGEPRIREAEYKQEGTEITIEIGDYEMQATYDGQNFARAERAPRHEGFYKEEIKRISMLGDGKSLEWHRTEEGLVIKTPNKKPCDYAYVFKIERYHYPKID